jgi:hypothetical protein
MTAPFGSPTHVPQRNRGMTGDPIAALALLPAIPPSDHDERRGLAASAPAMIVAILGRHVQTECGEALHQE